MKYLTIILLAFFAVSCNNEKPEDQPKPKPTHYDVKLNASSVALRKVKIIYYVSGEQNIINREWASATNYDTTINIAVNDSIGIIAYSKGLTDNVKASISYSLKSTVQESTGSVAASLKIQN